MRFLAGSTASGLPYQRGARLSSLAAATIRTPLSADQFLFGDGPGCWGLKDRYLELLERVRGLDHIHRRYECAADFLDHAVVLVAERYAAGQLRAGGGWGDFGAYLDSNTGEWRPIPDPIEYLVRIARDRSTTVRRKREREAGRHVTGREHEIVDDGQSTVEDRESRSIVLEFQSQPKNADCAELHRLHEVERLTYDEILPILGGKLGLSSVSSIRGRVFDCRRRLREFTEKRYPSEASYWAGR